MRSIPARLIQSADLCTFYYSAGIAKATCQNRLFSIFLILFLNLIGFSQKLLRCDPLEIWYKTSEIKISIFGKTVFMSGDSFRFHQAPGIEISGINIYPTKNLLHCTTTSKKMKMGSDASFIF